MLLLKHSRTFENRGKIKGLGGTWSKGRKAWVMPDAETYNKALEICEGQESAVQTYRIKDGEYLMAIDD